MQYAALLSLARTSLAPEVVTETDKDTGKADMTQ